MLDPVSGKIEISVDADMVGLVGQTTTPSQDEQQGLSGSADGDIRLARSRLPARAVVRRATSSYGGLQPSPHARRAGEVLSTSTTPRDQPSMSPGPGLRQSYESPALLAFAVVGETGCICLDPAADEGCFRARKERVAERGDPTLAEPKCGDVN